MKKWSECNDPHCACREKNKNGGVMETTQEIKIQAVNVGEISDGYHTFNELYDHRIALFIALARCRSELAWKSIVHEDGKGLQGWFIMGMELPGVGQISYHLPMKFWNDVKVRSLERGMKWDGHMPKDTVDRLLAFDWSLPDGRRSDGNG